jgi:hypothetical protein
MSYDFYIKNIFVYENYNIKMNIFVSLKPIQNDYYNIQDK